MAGDAAPRSHRPAGGGSWAPRADPRLPAHWPDAPASRFAVAAGLRWHLQDSEQHSEQDSQQDSQAVLQAHPAAALQDSEQGREQDKRPDTARDKERDRDPARRPDILLLHGTGASSHSWAPLARRLRARCRLLAPDLPGQGFTELGSAAQSSLPGMARAVAALLRELQVQPEVIVGHSAGAAVAAALCLQGECAPRALVSINGALLPFGRAAAPVFSQAAKVLAALPVFPALVALHALPRKPIERMLRQTGSRVSDEMARCYRTLLGDPRHVTGTLRMMANWNLGPLQDNLERLHPPLHLLLGGQDAVVPAAQAQALHRRIPGAYLQRAPELGHLAHEEDPAWVAAYLSDLLGIKSAP